MSDFDQFIRNYKTRLRRINIPLLFLVAIAAGYGIAFIYGTGQLTGDHYADMWIKQLLWIVIGTVLMLVIIGIDCRIIGKYAWLIYVLSVAGLVMVLFLGRTINGAKSWLRLAPGINIQPAEFAKFGLIVMLSWMASRPSRRFERIRELAPFAFVAGIPFGLIILQPDYGSAGVLIPITIGILFVSGIPLRWLAYALLATVLISPVVYRYGLKDHQRRRISTFLNPSQDARNEGWNARQSLLAVGSGGLFGKGYMKGTQNVLGFLPRTVAPTDFIFSVIAEEMGFIGSAFLILVFCTILLLGVFIAMKARDAFGRNLACGISIMLCVHIYINIGMTMGMAPIIGIPLPFVSYGGSFMILVMSCIGILESVYCERRAHA